MKVYRRHNCQKLHPSDQSMARCVWRSAINVQGTGRYAVLAYCRSWAVTLFPTASEAVSYRAAIDARDCCSDCRRDHDTVQMPDFMAAHRA